MDDDLEISRRIQQAAKSASQIDGVSETAIERFLQLGEKADPAGEAQVAYKSRDQEIAYSRAKKTALRTLFALLAELLPEEARTAEPIGRDAIQQRIEPLVKGLAPDAWQEAAIRELTSRTFVLDVHGAGAALEAELSTGYERTARNVLWACFKDYGLTPRAVEVEFEGVCGGEYAHCRFSFYNSKDPYSDVVVHEAAHLLHYLKPERFGLSAPRGKERFVDVDYYRRELFAYACEGYSRVICCAGRALRVQFAERMREDAFSFPDDEIGAVSELVVMAARARNGWRTIRDATVVTSRGRRQSEHASSGIMKP